MTLARTLTSRGSFKLDLSANLAGIGWSALVQFLCIPFYIKFLGVAGYGLIGFYLMLQAVMQVLDFGITPTMNRELARYSVRPELAGEARDLVRTVETGYWAVGAAIGLTLMAAAPLIATRWIHPAGVPVESVKQAVVAMGILVVFQWPVSLYQAGLIGLHRQVVVNVIKICNATLNGGGALLVLWLVSRTARSFFLWQAAVALVQVTVLLICLWRAMPVAAGSPRLNFKLLRGISRFAAGMSGIIITAMVLTQLDKLIISRMFSLEVFGYYTLAGVFGSAVIMLITPVFNTIFPRFSALVAAREPKKVAELYHRCSQLMTVLIVPLTAVLALYSYEILLLWTRNPGAARHAASIATVLVIATALNGLMNLPYVLQLANGWTSLGLRLNIFFLVTVGPVIWFLATRYGPIGGAFGYLALMCTYVVLGVPLTHHRLLRGETLRWFTRDVGAATLAALLVVGISRVLPLPLSSPPVAVASLLVVLIAAVSAAAMASPAVRSGLLEQLAVIGATQSESALAMASIGPVETTPAPRTSELPHESAEIINKGWHA
ncbi:MAG: lipopolysaccharide biosynthesis protein [Terriglobales bacterium]